MFNGLVWYILTVLTLLLLIIEFLPLIFGARLLVDGASSIAARFNVPNIVIGLTIVAFGTSLRSILYILIGLGLLIVGGQVIVQTAVRLAQKIGLSERIIALTIVSIGTSLPELATSAVAAFKKNVDIAIGNIVGSNIFNVLLILGLSAVVYPVEVTTSSTLDLLVHTGTAGLLFAVIFIGKGRKVDRWEGAIFIGLYIAYITVLLTV